MAGVCLLLEQARAQAASILTRQPFSRAVRFPAGAPLRSPSYCRAILLPTPISDQKVPMSNWPPLVRLAVNLPCVFMPVMVMLPKDEPDNVAGSSLANAAARTV